MLKKTFKQLFGTAGHSNQTHMASFPWKDLQDIQQLEDLENSTSTTYTFIFKHSTRCGISSMMLRRFEGTWKEHAGNRSFYLLDLIQWRQVSNAVADKFGVMHQSPQVLVLKGSELIEVRSHGDIDSITPEYFK
jgi:bacillithiol system protein YtxJ